MQQMTLRLEQNLQQETKELPPAFKYVLAYMLPGRRISVRRCTEEVGPTELRKIISDLRNPAKPYQVEIRDEWYKGRDRRDRPCKFKVYWLTPAGQARAKELLEGGYA